MKYVAVISYTAYDDDLFRTSRTHTILYKEFTDEQAALDYVDEYEKEGYYDENGWWYSDGKMVGRVSGEVEELWDDETAEEYVNRYYKDKNVKLYNEGAA